MSAEKGTMRMMNFDYETAVKRSAALGELVPKGWRVFVIGNSVLGYHLSIGREDEPRTRTLRLDNDEDIERLLKVYIEQIESVSP